MGRIYEICESMSDNLPPDLDRLFEEQSDDLEWTTPQIVRCKCGHLVSVRIPSRCALCQKIHAYWVTIDGSRKALSQMDLGHLNNCVRMLAAKAEEYPTELRGKFEDALDILYAEIGSRDKEIAQLTGIQAAIQRSLAQ
jgi:hypothetical protein